MAVAQAASEFLHYLERSRLLTAEQIRDAAGRLEIRPNDPVVPLAKKFVKAGILTRLQVSRLLEGHYRGFFLDHYRIEEILGSGGMGWVYIARDMETDEEVALKMLCEKNEKDVGLLTRFRLEAEAGMMLDHQAIVKTRTISQTTGLYGDVHYAVMDLFKGVGVDEFVSMVGKIKPSLACHIVRYAAAGLHHGHNRGLIHRDVKPANILVDTYSNARIIDFGLSLVSKDDHGDDGDEFSLAMIFGHDCLGTADYIAPEQSKDSYNVDARADVYSLGATFYFMLTGQVMFPERRTRHQKILAQQSEEPPRVRELVPDIPAGVEQILNRMIAKDPNARYRTAKGVCLALQKFAKPTRVRFNFHQILDRRYAIAQQRFKLLNEQAQQKVRQTTLSECSLDSKTTRPSESVVDTEVARDTDVRLG